MKHIVSPESITLCIEDLNREAERLLPAVIALSRKYPSTIIDHRRTIDFEQIAIDQLVRAIDQYDPLLGSTFSTFVYGKCLYAFRHACRDYYNGRISRRKYELDSNSVDIRAAVLLSLDDFVSVERSTPIRLGAVIADPTDAYEPICNRDLAESVWIIVDKYLDDRSSKLLRLRYQHGLRQADVAELFNISQMQVSRLERKALARLRSTIKIEVLYE